MKYIDLFAGIGGFHYGIDQSIKAECVYSSEWDRYANSVYKRHFGKCDSRDIRTVDAESIPNHDLLVGGFPCQSFSIAGLRHGFADTRGTLFFEIARILKAKRPAYLLLENVKGLLSHEHGRTFETIMRTLDELGYDLQWEVCNSKNFGVPQNRERVLIVGHLRGKPRPKVFPIGGSYPEADGQTASTAIDANYWKGVDNHGQRTMIQVIGSLDDAKWKKFNESSRRVYSPEGIAPTIPTVAGGGHTPKIVAPLVTPFSWSKSHRTGTSEADKRRHNYGQIEERIKLGEFNTLATGEGGKTQSSQNFVLEGMRIRRLTPLECERLQAFPDNWTKEGVSGELMSDTQKYKMCGNAVTTNVITEVIKRMFKV